MGIEKMSNANREKKRTLEGSGGECAVLKRHTLLQHIQLPHSHLMSANIRIKERVRI
jgi:hypothetical protein